MILKMSRLWNHEIPKSPRYDALDLFSGKGLVKARQLHFLCDNKINMFIAYLASGCTLCPGNVNSCP